MSANVKICCVRLGLTFDLRFLQGMQADDTARLLDDFVSAAESTPSVELTSSLGRIGRGGMLEVL